MSMSSTSDTQQVSINPTIIMRKMTFTTRTPLSLPKVGSANVSFQPYRMKTLMSMSKIRAGRSSTPY